MRGSVVLFSCAVACVMAPAAVARTNPAARLVTIHPEGAAPQRGIGLVHLEETQAAVAQALGAGHQTESGVQDGETYAGVNYRIGSVTLEVGYTDGLVSGVSTKSSGVILFGHPLSDGLKVVRRILHGRRGWRIDACHHSVFTALAPGGPGTGIEWKNGKLKLLMIDVGGVLDDCAVL